MPPAILRIASFAVAAVGLCLSAARPARAEDDPTPDRGQLTIDVGAGLASGHLQPSSVSGTGPVVYAAFELQVRVRGPLGVGLLLGGSDVTGWTVGANLRAEAHTSRRVFLSAGVGPEVSTGGDLGGLVLIEGDATVSVRFTTNAALAVGPRLAVVTNHEGTPGCGVDTCPAWATPGDRLFILRAGVGLAF